jgi:UDP-N-acetyl-D-mannosaminuronic acid transferase (WecB/TagA/CpsF family)
MLAGVYRKAPKLVRSAGLEGVWRVLLDPKRIKRFPNPIRFIRIIWHS